MDQILLVAKRHTSRWTNSSGVDQLLEKEGALDPGFGF
jgi:hypothetical protein